MTTKNEHLFIIMCTLFVFGTEGHMPGYTYDGQKTNLSVLFFHLYVGSRKKRLPTESSQWPLVPILNLTEW